MQSFRSKHGSASDNHIHVLRQLVLAAAPLFLVWGIVTSLVENAQMEIWPLRIGISIAFAGLWYIPKVRKIALLNYEYLISIMCSIAVSYAFFVSWKEGLHPAWVIGSVLIIMGSLNFLSQMGPIIIFSIFSAALSVSAFYFESQDPKITPGSLVLNFLTAIVLGVYSSIQRNNFLRRSMESESTQDLIFSNMREGLVMHAADGTILSINKAAPKILGLSEDQILGKSNIDPQWKTFKEDGTVCPPSEHPSAVAQATGKPVINFPIRLHKADGCEAWLKISAVPVFEEGKSTPVATIVTIEDVTEVREAKKVIDEQRESLVVASGLTSLGEMAGGIAHEINNPLAIIIGRIGLLKRLLADGKGTSAEAIDMMTAIEATTYRISRIVKSMKALSRNRSSDDFTISEIAKIVEDVVEVSKEKIKAQHIHLTVDVPSGLSIECHPGQVGQMILNFLGNAVDAIENLPEKWIRVQAIDRDQWVEISVTDSGSGIPKDIQAKILQPFFTTKEVGKGTGLGLSLARSVVTAHGGTLKIDNECANTSFVVSLPKKQTH